ncbi:hypothetical protein B5T_01308 [Alloalcanivorax dieselolei B5]|uniref:DUF427 domain-containing protein n=1 Tax=Alcanivorax dieselolei (strain DSM 16502 / CGMCC 1.3690 / MCCC 1A00001 / B-5) TaxID=930169 RepID=K0CDE6_ALCDB|nr:DUF427 domain-containing protein [Alloalcanivorax dieselolei]AFT69591.1 hypothetical protein B5T_01308 [Alloalcanivorax dieselolei B5]GGK03911.1 hypothetical protein GCM10007426_36110 [Alloalcanivorax dieselolei]
MSDRPIKQPGPDHPIDIHPTPGRVVVIADGAIVADSRATLTVSEAGLPDVYYIPRADTDLSLLTPTPLKTYCPYKGEASYFSLPGEQGENAVWSYPKPFPAVAQIKEYLAFYPERVEDIRILPEA